MKAFTGMEFLFRFLPAFLAVYYITPKKFRNTTLLCGSILFYAVGEPYFVLLLAAAVWLNYVFASKVERYRNHHKEKKKSTIWLVIALVIDAGLLTAFKLSGAFLGTGILPLGLSFYTFKMISFQIDVYKGEIKEVPAFQRTAVYFTMFPQLVSGPIMRYNEGIMAANEREYSWEKVEEGLWYFSIGLGTKVLLADRLAILWKDISEIGYESISTPLAWLGAVGYSMELYFDFWGYSLMASGICVMLGMPFILNFDHPYAAKSIGEFWRRWHITLGSWMRDYVFYPVLKSDLFVRIGEWSKGRLGKKRGKKVPTYLGMVILWFTVGLWHGGSWKYIVGSGLLHCFYIAGGQILDPLFQKMIAWIHVNTECFSYHLFQSLRTGFLVCTGFV